MASYRFEAVDSVSLRESSGFPVFRIGPVLRPGFQCIDDRTKVGTMYDVVNMRSWPGNIVNVSEDGLLALPELKSCMRAHRITYYLVRGPGWEHGCMSEQRRKTQCQALSYKRPRPVQDMVGKA